MDDEDEPRPEYGEDGVDLTLIRWFLTLTPAERLAALENYLDDVTAMRERNAAS